MWKKKKIMTKAATSFLSLKGCIQISYFVIKGDSADFTHQILFTGHGGQCMKAFVAVAGNVFHISHTYVENSNLLHHKCCFMLVLMTTSLKSKTNPRIWGWKGCATTMSVHCVHLAPDLLT